MTRYNSPQHDDQVRLLHNAGYTPEKIAGILKDFDAKTIRRHCVRMGLIAAAPHARPERIPAHTGNDPANPVEHARLVLGKRVTERNGSYWLDGRRPVSARDLVKEANRVRARDGLLPFGPESWR